MIPWIYYFGTLISPFFLLFLDTIIIVYGGFAMSLVSYIYMIFHYYIF